MKKYQLYRNGSTEGTPSEPLYSDVSPEGEVGRTLTMDQWGIIAKNTNKLSEVTIHRDYKTAFSAARYLPEGGKPGDI